MIKKADASRLFLLVLIAGSLYCLSPLFTTCYAMESEFNENASLNQTSIEGNATSYNVTLLITDWDEASYFRGLNISIYDVNGTLILSGRSDNNGSLSINLEENLYIVLVSDNGRMVGRQQIYVNRSGLFVIKTWAYRLRITCIDLEERYVAGASVFLYEQVINYSQNSTTTMTTGENVTTIWRLTHDAVTDENGTVIFNGVWNGTYRIVVKRSKVIGEKILNVSESKDIMLECQRTSLELRVLASTHAETPLQNATVTLQDSAGNTVFRGYTDQNGCIKINNIYVDEYRVFVDFLGFEVYSGVINTGLQRNVSIKASVFEASLKVVDPSGNPIPYSKVHVIRVVWYWRPYSWRSTTLTVKEVETDEQGRVTLLLPSGKYDFSVHSGIFFGSLNINLMENYSGTLNCSIHHGVWIILFLVSLPLSILSLLIERKRLKKPMEYRRYRRMLAKLESMYSSGLVEYKIYRKLKEEYETKIMELSGRRRR
ncbi:carboxypeptidase regulatory-like domain-containing protein [Candidatus Bathyarchaeota archaeon]|nr:carboxypeptidase regulatory-like domain-containing protein [Candidatus Bathyarchaeota archaeon]